MKLNKNLEPSIAFDMVGKFSSNSELSNYPIMSFYSFVNIERTDVLLYKILYYAKRKNIKGTIILANEGFNGSISGNKESLEFLINHIINQTNATDITIKINYSEFAPFNKLKVKLKPEIINMGVGSIDVNKFKGHYIEPSEWDDFISNAVLIDTRNDYEIEYGTFKNSINPNTKTFKEFPDWFIKNKDFLNGKKIAMCCTGGIRCEKSTAYLNMNGFKEVYHLKGGILQYLEDTKNKNNLWEGSCFVFDERESLDNNLAPL